MSRCFPFPPPGYDKKIATHETDPLIKEKHKEKKHKNDKDKEKKSKDRSRDKHKERKEKHKERKDKEKDKEKCKPLEEKEAEALTNTGHREKLVTNTVQNNSNGESKYVQELARRIRHDEEATGSQSAQKITNQKVQVTNDRDNDDKRINTQRNFTVARSSENAVARASFGADQRRTVAMGKPMENRDKARHTESPHSKENVTMSDKPRDKEGVKKHVAKDTDRNKEKKTVSVNKTHKEKPKLIEGPKLEERGKDSLDIMNGRPPDMSRGSVNSLIAEKSLGKRMDLDTNGLLYENGTKPNKLQRHSASVSSVENGRTLGPHRSPASEMQGTTCKPEVKEVKINGFAVSGEKEKALSLSPLAARVKVKENGEAPPKPPHPDLKYLDHILSVPKRELFLEVDNDEEWLYGPLGVKLKKARTYYPDSGESLQVWNQAFEIESADISALPYVVPF